MRVLDAGGRPVSDIEVRWYPLERLGPRPCPHPGVIEEVGRQAQWAIVPGEPAHTATTDARGEAPIPNLPPGRWQLRAREGAFAAVAELDRPLRSPRRRWLHGFVDDPPHLELWQQPFRRLTLDVRDAEGRAVGRALVRVLRPVSELGVSRELPTPPGGEWRRTAPLRDFVTDEAGRIVWHLRWTRADPFTRAEAFRLHVVAVEGEGRSFELPNREDRRVFTLVAPPLVRMRWELAPDLEGVSGRLRVAGAVAGDIGAVRRDGPGASVVHAGATRLAEVEFTGVDGSFELAAFVPEGELNWHFACGEGEFVGAARAADARGRIDRAAPHRARNWRGGRAPAVPAPSAAGTGSPEGGSLAAICQVRHEVRDALEFVLAPEEETGREAVHFRPWSFGGASWFGLAPGRYTLELRRGAELLFRRLDLRIRAGERLVVPGLRERFVGL